MRSTKRHLLFIGDFQVMERTWVGPLRYRGIPASLASYIDVGLNTYSVGSRVGKPPNTRFTAARVAKTTACGTS